MILSSLTTSQPDLAAAVRVGEATMSRAELVAAARAFAAALPERGAGARPVAVHAVPSLDTVVAVVGCVLSGTTVVPVPPDSGPAELAHVLRDSGAGAWAGAPHEHVDLPVVSWRTPDDPAAEAALTPQEHAGPAVLLYTSGTTGAPKGVELSARAIAAGLDGLAEAWGWTDADTVVHGLPLFHVHGLILGLMGSLRVGSRFWHTVKPTPEAYAAAATADPATTQPAGTMFFGVPTVWSRVVEKPELARALGSARLLVSGSAPLPVSVFTRLTELTGQPPIERYGMSETLITLSTRVDGERRPGWVGLPVGGTETRLRGEAGAEVPDDGETVGRLEVRGPLLFDGYRNRPDANAEAWTEDGWFVTGDLACRDAQGFHRIVGRESTDLIKSGGYRIGSGEIEQVLLDHPAVREVAVVGQPDADLGQRIVAYVVPAGDPAEGLDRELVDLVATELSWHKRPREVVFTDALPRNAMGKVQKKLLLEG